MITRQDLDRREWLRARIRYQEHPALDCVRAIRARLTDMEDAAREIVKVNDSFFVDRKRLLSELNTIWTTVGSVHRDLNTIAGAIIDLKWAAYTKELAELAELEARMGLHPVEVPPQEPKL